MTTGDEFRILDVVVLPSVYDHLAAHLYTEAGATDLDTYFESYQSTVPRGDPVAEVTHPFLATIVQNFATLYDVSDFTTPRTRDPEMYRRLQLAATPSITARARELFRATQQIQECDLRIVHTAIIDAAIETYDLPSLPDNAICTDSG